MAKQLEYWRKSEMSSRKEEALSPVDQNKKQIRMCIDSATMVQSEEPLRNLLKKIAKEHNYENPEIIINSISSGGANYTSALYTAIIKAKNKEDLNLFGKVAAVGEKFRSEATIDFYGNEKFAYTTLFKIFEALEEEHGVPEEHRLPFVKFYGFDASAQYLETMVLENLITQGYEAFDRRGGARRRGGDAHHRSFGLLAGNLGWGPPEPRSTGAVTEAMLAACCMLTFMSGQLTY
ncbi:hypothetical protein B5X24_HaOG204908 [Helicoverpa armigera]|uniref:Uncharacterized protein n=1 Tax=Helicoverpa armigera TaxID=29058 RepID=A0A2W1BMR9_HELAM|nr:hypothetical protein B5X24_HaOG204908 [Helicoverpa armigera]